MYLTKRGFTLIELLVVIAIIGILSSIVLASLNTARQKSRDARRVADIKQLQLAMQLFYDANSSYPTSTAGVLTGALSPTYIATIPRDPVGNVAYPYDPLQLTGLGNATVAASYHICAALEDGANQALQSDIDTTADTGNVDSGADTVGCVTGVTTRYGYDVGP